MTNYSFTVSEREAGERLDKFLSANIPEMTRSALVQLIEKGYAGVNGIQVPKKYKLIIQDAVTLTVPEPETYQAQAEPIPLDIVFEDDVLLVVNKPKGMVVHPAAGNYTGTLVNGLLHYCKDSLSGINGVMRPGIVHRIDKNTSGLLVVAKNDFAHQHLASQIQSHSLCREYIAVVRGNIKTDDGTVSAPIGRHHTDRKRMTVTDRNSKPAVTHYRVLERYKGYTYIACKLETGRTHQIRVHMAYIGHPVAGDDVYGGSKIERDLQGQCLHAKRLELVHPKTGETMIFECEIPLYFSNFLKKLSNITF